MFWSTEKTCHDRTGILSIHDNIVQLILFPMHRNTWRTAEKPRLFFLLVEKRHCLWWLWWMLTWDRRFYFIQIIKNGVPCRAHNSQTISFILGEEQGSHFPVDGSVRSIYSIIVERPLFVQNLVPFYNFGILSLLVTVHMVADERFYSGLGLWKCTMRTVLSWSGLEIMYSKPKKLGLGIVCYRMFSLLLA